MNFYKHHLGDYDGHTAHLTWDEDMAYTRLLRAYYRREKPILAEEAYRLARASSKAQRAAVDSVLAEFFFQGEGGWHNKRADEEVAAYQAQCETNREVGKRGGRPRKTESVSGNNRSGFVNVTETKPNDNPNQNQIPEPEKSKALSGKPDAPSRINGKARHFPDAENILKYLNSQSERNYQFRNPAGALTANADFVVARLLEGYTKEQLREVVYAKCREWKADEKMCIHLTPETLFNKTNFAKYIGQIASENAT